MDMADCKDDRLTLEQMLAVPHAFYSEPQEQREGAPCCTAWMSAICSLLYLLFGSLQVEVCIRFTSCPCFAASVLLNMLACLPTCSIRRRGTSRHARWR